MASLAQISLSATYLAAATGIYAAFSPPNPSSDVITPETGDTVSDLNLAGDQTTKIGFIPTGLLSLHAAALSYSYPSIPPRLLFLHGAENTVNPSILTWSATTAVPLALILCVGAPLRLIPYAGLGEDFTFALRKPDRLVTTGIYRYVQHPSYVGIVVLAGCQMALLWRVDGPLACWIAPAWYGIVRDVFYAVGVASAVAGFKTIWTRVKEEESMLREAFGAEWEKWHAKTARFIPGII